MKRVRSAATLAAIAVAALALTACTSSSTPETKTLTQLTASTTTAPISLNPATANSGPGYWYIDPAYASVLTRAADGTIGEGLAEKWGYVGEDNKTFEFTLRSGLEFADGTALDADSVVKSIEYFASQAGPFNAYYTGLKLTAVDDTTVRITTDAPNPEIDQLLTQEYAGSDVISPAGLADPDKLAGATFGAGPYVLDAAATIPNDTYVYTPNKKFWNQDAIHFEKITLKVIPTIQTAVQSLKSGQIQAMQGDSSVAPSVAETEGVETINKAVTWAGLYLLDRDGTILPAMKDIRVRQALNYAIDRESLTKAGYGDFGSPTASPELKGFDAYDEALTNAYPQDIDKAKSLLAEAGYGDGLTIAVNYMNFDPGSTRLIQALAAQLSEVGVTLELKGDSNFGEWVQDVTSLTMPATMLNTSGAAPMYFDAQFGYLPTAIMNPFKVSDPDVNEGFDALVNASEADSADAARALNKVIVDKALALPIVSVESLFFHSSSVQGMEFVEGSPSPTSITLWTSK